MSRRVKSQSENAAANQLADHGLSAEDCKFYAKVKTAAGHPTAPAVVTAMVKRGDTTMVKAVKRISDARAKAEARRAAQAAEHARRVDVGNAERLARLDEEIMGIRVQRDWPQNKDMTDLAPTMPLMVVRLTKRNPKYRVLAWLGLLLNAQMRLRRVHGIEPNAAPSSEFLKENRQIDTAITQVIGLIKEHFNIRHPMAWMRKLQAEGAEAYVRLLGDMDYVAREILEEVNTPLVKQVLDLNRAAQEAEDEGAQSTTESESATAKSATTGPTESESATATSTTSPPAAPEPRSYDGPGRLVVPMGTLAHLAEALRQQAGVED